jgi:hypothetical protein
MEHWNASSHDLRFLSGDPDRGLVFWRNEVMADDNIFWFVDSAFAPGAKFFHLISWLVQWILGSCCF